MALSFPLDILPAWPGVTMNFDLVWNKQVSRQANGADRIKDLGTPLWKCNVKSRELKPSDLDHWRAILNSMDGGEKTFKGYNKFRSYPILYPNGTWPTGASFDGVSSAIESIGASNNALALNALPVGYVISVGDFISVAYSSTKYQVFQAMESVTADGSGITAEFEVRPYVPTGMAVADVVSVKHPFCLMTIDPGSLSITNNDVGRGTITFSATQYI